MKQNEDPSSAGFKIAQSLIENVIPEQSSMSIIELKSSMAPIIANEIYRRELAVIERERMLTIFNMARVFDNETMEKAINALHYQLKH